MTVWVLLVALSTLSILIFFAYRHIQIQHHKQLEAVRAHHSLELQRFVRRVDHEIKNPLTAIRFALANIHVDPQAAISSIELQTVRISSLLKNLRKLTELSTLSIEQIPVDVYSLLQEVRHLAIESQPSRQISVDHNAVKSIQGDKYLLLLALYNLIDNALKYSEDEIIIHTWDTAHMVQIDVEDSGPGIAPDDVMHVWEELYRGSSVHHITGSGLGLALVKSIVERHGGSVTLKTAVDAGTTVTIYLPGVQ